MLRSLSIRLLPILILACLFIGATYVGDTYETSLINLLKNLQTPFLGKLAYIGLMVLATVVAPLATLPFMPIATSLWGPFETALLSVVGWSIGAVIAFYISRRYGMPLVQRYIKKETYQKIDDRIPARKHILISIILLRMIIPVDVLSYALGLIPRIPWRTYIIGSVIGVIPFSFVFAYLGNVPIHLQITTFSIILLIFAGYSLYQNKTIIS